MYIPLHIYSHYSVLQGLNNPKEIIDKAKKEGFSSISLTDINNCSGCIEFYKEAKKQNIKPIIGSVITTNEGSILLIALNNLGYIELLQITAKLNSHKYQSILPLDELSRFNLENIVCITGHEGSTLYNSLVYKFNFKTGWEDLSNINLAKLKFLFKNNLYIELQYSEYDNFSQEVKSKLIDLSKKYQIELIACPRVYFLNKEDEELHQILVSTKEKKSISAINQINSRVYKFFHGYDFHLPIQEEFAARINNKEAIKNTIKLADSVEDYNPNKNVGTGFVFEKFDSSSLMIALIRAFENFRDKKKWRELQKRAMAKDFSWHSSAKKYVALFLRAIEIHNRY